MRNGLKEAHQSKLTILIAWNMDLEAAVEHAASLRIGFTSDWLSSGFNTRFCDGNW
jgi:hypothetical protein